MPESTPDESVDWSRDTQKIAVLTWISFLCASAFAVVAFAFIDPIQLLDIIGLPDSDETATDRNLGYALGFFFLWVHGLASGWLVLRLVRRKRNWPRRP